MDIRDAVRIVYCQTPCAHESYEVVGAGQSYKCSDCGGFFDKDVMSRAKESQEKFEEAVKLLERLAEKGLAGEAPLEDVPKGYLSPHIVSFKNAIRTNAPKDFQDSIEGTVGWRLTAFGDSGLVTDRNGKVHNPKPLFLKKET